MDNAQTGIDILEVARMERVLARTPRFKERVFTADERAYCDRSARPAAHYACRFAAREAVLKCLGCGFSRGVGVQDVSVFHDVSGRPRVQLGGRAAEIAAEQGIDEIAISLSFTASLAVAQAVAVSEAVRPSKDEARDVQAELAASFKEARSIMDELERDEFERVPVAASATSVTGAYDLANAELADAVRASTNPVRASIDPADDEADAVRASTDVVTAVGLHNPDEADLDATESEE